MKKWFTNEKGLTLAELLATLVIGSIVVISLMATFVFIQKQFTTQSAAINEQTDISIALKSITRDARAAQTFVSMDESTITFHMDENDITYALEGDILKRNNTSYIYDIEKFEIEIKGDEENKVHVLIESGSGKKMTTEIVKRGGEDLEDDDEAQGE